MCHAMCNQWELLLKKYPIELFKARKKNHFDVQDDIKIFKKEVFGDNYKENELSSQLIRSIETMTVATVCGILEKDELNTLYEKLFPIVEDGIVSKLEANKVLKDIGQLHQYLELFLFKKRIFSRHNICRYYSRF